MAQVFWFLLVPNVACFVLYNLMVNVSFWSIPLVKNPSMECQQNKLPMWSLCLWICLLVLFTMCKYQMLSTRNLAYSFACWVHVSLPNFPLVTGSSSDASRPVSNSSSSISATSQPQHNVKLEPLEINPHTGTATYHVSHFWDCHVRHVYNTHPQSFAPKFAELLGQNLICYASLGIPK